MRDVLKQRLVGALVIIALGAIFWPLVFVDVERAPIDRSSQVPPMPEHSYDAVEPPAPLQGVEPVSAADAIALHDAPPQAIDDPIDSDAAQQARAADDAVVVGDADAPEPVLDENGIPVAWVLQVISVSKRDKAESLADDLIAQGYKAYHRPVKIDADVLHRVYVGPVFDRDRLLVIKQAVDEQLKVDAIIARYVP